METKAEIRKNNIRNRKQIAKDDVEYASDRICERIIKKEWFNKNSSLFVYSACNNEVDLDKVIKQYNGLLEIKSNLNEGFSVFMVFGRLISGVHWLTDIVGSIMLSIGLFCIYKAAVLLCYKREN